MATEIIREIQNMMDSGDEWGINRELAFGIAFTLYLRDESMPDAWQFRPADTLTESSTRDECFPADMLLCAYDAGDITGDELRAFGDKLNSERDELDAAGKSY